MSNNRQDCNNLIILGMYLIKGLIASFPERASLKGIRFPQILQRQIFPSVNWVFLSIVGYLFPANSMTCFFKIKCVEITHAMHITGQIPLPLRVNIK